MYDSEMREALKTTTNPWSDKKVLDIADKMMKMSYYAACKVLEDLPSFLKTRAEEEERSLLFDKNKKKKTDAEVYSAMFKDVNHYQYEAFDHFTSVYHAIRSGKKWGKVRLTPEGQEAYEQNCWIYGKTVAGAEEYYKEGTPQNLWRALYNDYCDRFAAYETHLNFNPGRVQKDLDLASFTPAPNFHPAIRDEEVDRFISKPLTMGDQWAIDECSRRLGQIPAYKDKSDAAALKIAKETSIKKHEMYGTLELHVFFGKTTNYSFCRASR